MRAAATAVLVLALAPFLQACLYAEGCSREEAPEFSAAEEQITRKDVVADLGEPIKTIKSEDGHRVDVYEYDQSCGFVELPLPILFPLPSPDQMLTVEYGPDGSFLTAQVWPNAATPEAAIMSHERRVKIDAERRVKLEGCDLPFSEAIQLDAPTQFDFFTYCPNWRSDLQTGARPWLWTCLAAHGRYPAAQRRMGGILLHRGETVQSYKWFKLASPSLTLLANSREMTPEQIAEAERLVAEWEPNPTECEVGVGQVEN